MASSKPAAKRKSIRAKAASAGISKPFSHSAVSRPVIQPTKKDKRQEKHERLLNKIASSTPNARKNASRRRKKSAARENSALTSTLESLVNALPETIESNNMISASSKDQMAKFKAKKSIPSKAGAAKKKDKVVQEEIQRFGRNLAVMNKINSGNTGSTWAAIRGFVGSTLEKKEEFLEKEKESNKGMEID